MIKEETQQNLLPQEEKTTINYIETELSNGDANQSKEHRLSNIDDIDPKVGGSIIFLE
jgi:hypothetical protein